MFGSTETVLLEPSTHLPVPVPVSVPQEELSGSRCSELKQVYLVFITTNDIKLNKNINNHNFLFEQKG